MGKTYMYPFARGVGWKSQRFGANPNNGINPRGGHTGDDWAVEIGTPIYAAGDGVIELSGWPTANHQDSGYWLMAAAGDALVLNCGDNEPTFIYGHNSDTPLPVGTRVRKGDLIAYSGTSGLSTGPHAHVETVPPGFVLDSPTYGRVNPERYFSEYIDDLPKNVKTTNHVIRSAEDMKIIARQQGTDHVYIGDYITRRHIGTEQELDDLRWAALSNYGPPIFDGGKIQDVPRIDFIGKLV